MSLKAPYIVEEAKKALAEGHSVVIGLQTTEEVYALHSLGICVYKRLM